MFPMDAIYIFLSRRSPMRLSRAGGGWRVDMQNQLLFLMYTIVRINWIIPKATKSEEKSILSFLDQSINCDDIK